MFSILLRVVEGTGNAMFYTASYTLLTHLYIEKKGMIVVRGIILHQLLNSCLKLTLSHCDFPIWRLYPLEVPWGKSS